MIAAIVRSIVANPIAINTPPITTSDQCSVKSKIRAKEMASF
jgi:hypothetical protein